MSSKYLEQIIFNERGRAVPFSEYFENSKPSEFAPFNQSRRDALIAAAGISINFLFESPKPVEAQTQSIEIMQVAGKHTMLTEIAPNEYLQGSGALCSTSPNGDLITITQTYANSAGQELVFVADTNTGNIIEVRNNDGTECNAPSNVAAVNNNGTIAFETQAQIDPADTDIQYNVYKKDISAPAVLLNPKRSYAPSIAPDGTTVYRTNSNKLFDEMTLTTPTGVSIPISVDLNGNIPRQAGAYGRPSIVANGKDGYYVSFIHNGGLTNDSIESELVGYVFELDKNYKIIKRTLLSKHENGSPLNRNTNLVRASSIGRFLVGTTADMIDTHKS